MIERSLDGLREKMEDPAECSYMTVVVPGDIDPFERHYRCSVYIDAELRLSGLGCSVGGGTLFFEGEDESDGEDEIACCILDVDPVNIDRARKLIRLHMPELGAPAGTLVQWDKLEDRFDGRRWHLALPRSVADPWDD